MQDLRVTLVQANQIWENPEANYDNYAKLLKSVDTDLIVLPEMFNTCFSMNRALAEPFQESRALSWLRNLSKQKNAAVYTSFMTEDGGRFVNRGMFITPEGEEFIYDKRKTFGMANEHEYFDSGTERTTVDYKGWKFQLQICYDLRFPEIVRNKISNQSPEYDVILYVANWPKKRSQHWTTLLRARAIENQCIVIGVNRVGIDGMQFEYSGDSRMIDALGTEETLQKGKEMATTYVMKYDELEKIREKLPFLKDAST